MHSSAHSSCCHARTQQQLRSAIANTRSSWPVSAARHYWHSVYLLYSYKSTNADAVVAMPERSSTSSPPSSSSINNTSSYPVSGARHYCPPPACTPAHRRPAAAGAHFTCFTGTKAQILARGTPRPPQHRRPAAEGPQFACFTNIKVQILTYCRAADFKGAALASYGSICTFVPASK